MIVAFTGTRKGMSLNQRMTCLNILKEMKPDEVHHGDCIGADADFHKIAQELGLKIIIHPPVSDVYRSHCKGAFLEHEPKTFLKRNHDIVDCADVLITAPWERNGRQKRRSGTWATYRYAYLRWEQKKMAMKPYLLER